MEEEAKEIQGYKGRYEITRSGRVISLLSKRPLARCKDEYGFHIVKLTDEHGHAENHNVFALWKQAFQGVSESEFKGALKAKYGAKCSNLNE